MFIIIHKGRLYRSDFVQASDGSLALNQKQYYTKYGLLLTTSEQSRVLMEYIAQGVDVLPGISNVYRGLFIQANFIVSEVIVTLDKGKVTKESRVPYNFFGDTPSARKYLDDTTIVISHDTAIRDYLYYPLMAGYSMKDLVKGAKNHYILRSCLTKKTIDGSIDLMDQMKKIHEECEPFKVQRPMI